MADEEYLTLSEAAAFLKIGKGTLYNLRAAGRIKTHYPFGEPQPGVPGRNQPIMPRIKKSELVELMERGGVR